MVNINLRKASQLQNAIRQAIIERASLITGETTMYYWRASDEQIAVDRTKQLLALDETERLEDILNSLRVKVGAANVKSKVNALLAEQKMLQNRIARLTRLTLAQPSLSSSEFAARVDALKEQNAKSPYGGHDEFSVGVLNQKDIDKFKDSLLSLRRRLNEITDILISENIQNVITISDGDYSWLESKGII